MPYRRHLNVTWLTATLMLLSAGGQAADIHISLLETRGKTHATVYAALLPISDEQWQASPVSVLKVNSPQLIFSDIAAGEYAVQLFIDLNGNNQLDTSARGIPREPVGFSNNPSLLKGMPDIRAAAFEHGTHPRELIIRLRHPRGNALPATTR